MVKSYMEVEFLKVCLGYLEARWWLRLTLV